MELINQSGCPAELFVSEVADGVRAGYLAVKATLRVLPEGGLELDESSPMPVLDQDVETTLGTLPSDLVTREADRIDLIVHGAAHAPDGVPTRSMTVRLSVGSNILSELLVTGDRTWLGRGADAQITPPLEFTRMPLTWSRAYGGAVDLRIDDESRIPVQHVVNPAGRGFDASARVDGLRIGWGMAGATPEPVERHLPNVESPLTPIESWSDDPLPTCWDVMPAPYEAFAWSRSEERLRGAPPRAHGHRAMPALRVAPPSPGDWVSLEGCTANGSWAFRWPALGFTVDYEVGDRAGALTLEPTTVVLSPEESRVGITYRARFKFERPRLDGPRSLRLKAS